MLKKIATEVTYSLYNLFHPSYRDDVNYIFIIGHMRSGSSLLVQLLRHNEEIIGLGESHLIYNNSSKLGHLSCKLLYYNGGFYNSIRKHKYALDKVLHNHYLPESQWSVLLRHNVRTIFIIRKPSDTIDSLRKSLNLNTNEAKEYYVSRLAYIERLSFFLRNNGVKYHSLTYDQLTINPDYSLDKLTKYLCLNNPLVKEYKIQNTTGRIGFGDFSNNILSGSILKKKAKSKQESHADELNRVYEGVVQSL